jgi:biotin carboxylase
MYPAAEANDRPRLTVVYGHRSLDVMQICDGARGWCDLIWLVDPADPSVTAVRPILRKFGVVVDALGQPPEEAAAALRVHSPNGLATFYDTGMERVAAIATELGLPFHSAQAGRNLEDKLHQREALRVAGLPTPRIAALAEDAERETVERLGAAVGYPAVLKPRRASGSWHTFPVSDGAQLGELWDQLAVDGSEEMLLEEYLPDGPAMPAGFEADYVSVETIVEPSGAMTHLAVTGRFPLAPPFRETGFFIPATLGSEQTGEVLDLATRTLRALGLAVGSAHTEIKLTSDGPRVIEVNGRIGGGVPDMLRLAAGVDIVRLSMRAALGLPIEVPELPRTTGVAYRFFYQPPESARRLESIEGLDRLKSLPGVKSLYLHHPPGTEIDARHGTRSYLFAVVGHAADHAGVLEVDRFLRTDITATYEHASDLPRLDDPER